VAAALGIIFPHHSIHSDCDYDSEITLFSYLILDALFIFILIVIVILKCTHDWKLFLRMTIRMRMGMNKRRGARGDREIGNRSRK
jgi:hypothetical protein